MPELERPPVLRTLERAAYGQNIADRVNEPNLNRERPYVLVAELDSEEIIAMQASVDGIVRHEDSWRANFMVGLHDPELGPEGRGSIFDSVDVDSMNGFLNLNTHRLYHRMLGHVGFLAQGYLLDSPAVFESGVEESAETTDIPAYRDTRTQVFEREGILIAYN